MQYATFRAVQICGSPCDGDGECLVSNISSTELTLSRTKKKSLQKLTQYAITGWKFTENVIIIYDTLRKDHDLILVLLVEGAKCWKKEDEEYKTFADVGMCYGDQNG